MTVMMLPIISHVDGPDLPHPFTGNHCYGSDSNDKDKPPQDHSTNSTPTDDTTQEAGALTDTTGISDSTHNRRNYCNYPTIHNPPNIVGNHGNPDIVTTYWDSYANEPWTTQDKVQLLDLQAPLKTFKEVWSGHHKHMSLKNLS